MAVSNSRVVDEQSQRAAMNITVNTGVGDPNAIAEAIDEVLQQAVSRGTLRGGLYAV
jgi:S-adenosylmethionine synthetase